MNKLLHTIDQWDKELFLTLNGSHNDFWDLVMWWASDKYIWVPLYALFLFMLWRQYRKNIWIVMVFTALLIFISDQVSVHLFKEVFERLRPCHEPELAGLGHLVNDKCGGQFGFYSSHASNTFAVATFLISLLRRKNFLVGSLVLLWAGFVSYSRIYLGAHYPGDVLAGALAGSILGIFFARFCLSAMKMKK